MLALVFMAIGYFWAHMETIGPVPPSSGLKQFPLARLYDSMGKERRVIAEVDTRRLSELLSDAHWERRAVPMKVIARLEFVGGPTVLIDLGRRAFSIEGVPGIYLIDARHQDEAEQVLNREVIGRVISSRS
jgi:hypothetical protein